jgi:hypothetical protein
VIVHGLKFSTTVVLCLAKNNDVVVAADLLHSERSRRVQTFIVRNRGIVFEDDGGRVEVRSRAVVGTNPLEGLVSEDGDLRC